MIDTVEPRKCHLLPDIKPPRKPRDGELCGAAFPSDIDHLEIDPLVEKALAVVAALEQLRLQKHLSQR